jgi:hypothetical protein
MACDVPGAAWGHVTVQKTKCVMKYVSTFYVFRICSPYVLTVKIALTTHTI